MGWICSRVTKYSAGGIHCLQRSVDTSAIVFIGRGGGWLCGSGVKRAQNFHIVREKSKYRVNDDRF